MPKKGKTTVRSGFLPFLWNLSHLSTARGSPPRINARGLTDTLSQRGSRAVGAVEIETSLKPQCCGNKFMNLIT